LIARKLEEGVEPRAATQAEESADAERAPTATALSAIERNATNAVMSGK
jgi:hypothetical protein